MARRPTSPPLVGRDRELADLLSAVDAHDPDRPVVLVAGEAGIGKTRLLGELVDRLRTSRGGGDRPAWAVARGSCLRLSEGELPFAPFLEILDEIRSLGRVESVESVRARLAGSTEAPDARSAASRSMRFVELHDALVGAAAAARLLVVLDDLHWADRSTLDLVLFLARRLRASPVTLIAAYRSDELHRRHPLRPVIAELSRGYVRERIELGPLDAAAVAQQIAAFRDVPADVVSEIATRSDGNPFYVEELVALDPGSHAIPASLRDILLARLAVLDEATARVLAACAVIGDQADAQLIEAVAALGPDKVDGALRVAVDRWILAPDPNGRDYRFRHALLEEAVLDDLLPGDRVDLHRRVSTVLRARDGAVPPGQLARHLDAGGHHDEAIDAYLEAAALAYRALAWTEGVAAFERAAELAAAAPATSRRRAETRLHDLVIRTAEAMTWSGSGTRAITLLRTWIALTEQANDTSAAAALWMTLTQVLNDVGDEAAAEEALAAVVRLRPPDNRTEFGLEVLTGLISGAWIHGRNREALMLGEQAVAGAERLGDPSLLFKTLVELAAARITLGHVERGLADVGRARRLQAEHGWLDTYGHLPTNIASVLADAGFLAPALELWQDGLRMSKELGVERSWDPWNLPGLAQCAWLAGRWTDADGPIAASRALKARGMPSHFVEAVAGALAAGRGDLEGCDASIALADEHGAGLIGDFEAIRGFMRAMRADAAGDPERRLIEAERAIRLLESTDSFVLRSRLAAEAASAAADLVGTLRPRSDAPRVADARLRARAAAALARDLDEGRTVPGTISVPWTRANAALAAAEAARAEGRDDPGAWAPIAEAFDAMGFEPHVASVRFRGAAAAFASGDRAAGTALLRESHGSASSIGMQVLLRRIDALARAARVDLATAPTAVAPEPRPPIDAWGLSARELEVVALLADGRTNGEIGARLFISTKTASVHVTHILDKLGVSTRTEAALLVSRAGLLDARLRQRE